MNQLRLFFAGLWKTARSSAGVISAVGLAVGLALAASTVKVPYFERHPLTRLIVEHVGLGLIVAAISVFGYEWGARWSETIGLSKRLEELLVAQGPQALDRALGELIGFDKRRLPGGARDIAANCTTVIMAISNLLRTPAEGARRRVDEQYASFVSGLLKSVVAKNADALVNLRQKAEVRFKVPATAAVLADDILAAQMRALKKGDTYEVVSDLGSWRGEQLQDFSDATRSAVESGVVVQRIFNLFGDAGDNKLTGIDIGNILHSHLAAMTHWKDPRRRGRYVAKVFGTYEKATNLFTQLTEARLATTHFGIFKLGPAALVQFRVTKDDLSEIMISRDPDEAKEQSQLFATLWEISSELSEATILRLTKEHEVETGKATERRRDRHREENERLLGERLLARLQEMLRDGGEIFVATDGNAGKTEVLDEWTLAHGFTSVRMTREPGGSPLEVVVPAFSGTAADLVLAANMKQLEEKETYDAISDLTSWQGNGLVRLRQETEAAVKKGAVVRRIFHVFRDEAAAVEPAEITAILAQHVKDSFRWSKERGQYLVRFFGTTELKMAIAAGRSMADLVQVEDFGIFGSRGNWTRFRVDAKDLARFSVASEHALIECDVDRFQSIWQFANEIKGDEEAVPHIARFVDELKAVDR